MSLLLKPNTQVEIWAKPSPSVFHSIHSNQYITIWGKLEIMFPVPFQNIFSRFLLLTLLHLRMYTHNTKVKWIDFSLVGVSKHILKQN